MTPEERTQSSLLYLRCCEMVSRSRERKDVAAQLLWEGLRDQWYLVLRREEMYPDSGPQGDAAR